MSQTDSEKATHNEHGKDLRHAISTSVVQDPDEQPEMSWRVWVVVATQALNYTSLITTLGACGFWASEVSGTIGGASLVLWFSQSYQVVQAVLAPPLAYYGDYYGRKIPMLVCILFGMLGNAIIAEASSMQMAIAGAVLFGVHFASSSNAFAIASEVIPRRYRGVAQVANNAGGNLGVLFGILAGSGFVTRTSLSWRGIYWFAFAQSGVVFILYAVAYQPRKPPRENVEGYNFMQRMAQFDFVGSFLLAAAFVPLLVGLIYGGVTYPWSSGTIIALLVVGCVMLVVLALHQIFIKKDGLFDHRLWRHRNAALAVAGIFDEGMIYIVLNQYFGELTAILFENRPTLFALRFSAFPMASTLASIFYAWISVRYKTMKPQIIFGFVAFLVGVIILATLPNSSAGDKLSIFAITFIGFGFGAPICFFVSYAQLAVLPHQIGLITGLTLVTRAVGGFIGTAICGAVFNSKIGTYLPEYIAEAGLANGLPASSLPAFVGGLATNNITLAESAPGVTPAILAAGGAAYKQAFSDAFHYVWYVVLPFIIIGLILCCFLAPTDKTMTWVVDRPVRHEFVHHEHHHAGHAENAAATDKPAGAAAVHTEQAATA